MGVRDTKPAIEVNVAARLDVASLAAMTPGQSAAVLDGMAQIVAVCTEDAADAAEEPL